MPPKDVYGFTGTVADTLQPSIPTAPEARANAEQPLERLLQGGVTPEQWGLDDALARQARDLDEVAGGLGADYTIGGKPAVGKALVNGIGDADEALTLSTRFVNRMDPLWKNADKIVPLEGYQDIVCHGDKLGFVFKDLDGKEANLAVTEFAEILKKSPVYNGGPIRLISCETGASDAMAAQYLAKHLGVDVIAPTDIVYVYPDGTIKIGRYGTGTWQVFKP